MTSSRLWCLVALSVLVPLLRVPRTFAQSPTTAATFDGRAVEDQSKVAGTTCSNAAVGITYDLPGTMPAEDPHALRVVESRGELARTGIGPEADYILWGARERRFMAQLCGAGNDRWNIVVIAVPQRIAATVGGGNVEVIVMQLSQTLGIRGGKLQNQLIAGRAFTYVESQGQGNIGGKPQEFYAATYATEGNSYVFVWQLFSLDSKQMTAMVDSLKSVKLASPVPEPVQASPQRNMKSLQIPPGFHARFSEFLAAWLVQRDKAKTLSFIAPEAYSAPAMIGTYCDGWYKRDMLPSQAEKIIADNLMGVPDGFPQGTKSQDMFQAWDRLPPEWTDASLNDISKDHYLVASIDAQSLSGLFPDQFAHSDYEQFLEKEVKTAGSMYWAVFPVLQRDGDVFVIFTLWQHRRDAWSIAHIDVVCQ